MDLNKLLEKHRAYWDCSNSDPLIAEVSHPDWKPRPYPLSENRFATEARMIEAGEMDVDRLLGIAEGFPELTAGDRINPVDTVYPVSWMASLLGCPIYASPYSCSAKPVVGRAGGGIADFDIAAALTSPWLGVMDSVLNTAVGAAGGERPVAQLHLRGVVDMLAAYLGEQRLCTALFDEPEELEKLAHTFADLFLEIAGRGLSRRPPWFGGFVSDWGVYGPGRLVDYQIDASSIISPDLYKRHLKQWDEKILTCFDFSVTHLHACGLHMIDNVLDTRGISAIEITLERETGVWEQDRIVSVCRKIQSRGKPVLINGELNDAELQEMLGSLKPEGLAVFFWKPKGS